MKKNLKKKDGRNSLNTQQEEDKISHRRINDGMTNLKYLNNRLNLQAGYSYI